MIALILCGILHCSPPQIVNNSGKAWDAVDQEHLEYASKRCGQIYSDAPCLKVFYKMDSGRYRALCGKEKPKYRLY